MTHHVRLSGPADTAEIGRLLHDFNFRAAIWSNGLECYLAELYVVPASRGRGLGRALMEAAISEARSRGADSMDIGVDEPDLAARNLYESLGFTSRTGGADGPLMYV